MECPNCDGIVHLYCLYAYFLLQLLMWQRNRARNHVRVARKGALPNAVSEGLDFCFNCGFRLQPDQIMRIRATFIIFFVILNLTFDYNFTLQYNQEVSILGEHLIGSRTSTETLSRLHLAPDITFALGECNFHLQIGTEIFRVFNNHLVETIFGYFLVRLQEQNPIMNYEECKLIL